MLPWTDFIAKHPRAHVLVGRTRDITQWRSAAVSSLIEAQGIHGESSVRRDLDDEQGHLLILIGLALEADAVRLARLLGAKKVDAYAGYGSVFEFDPALLDRARRRRVRPRQINRRRRPSRAPQ